MNKQDKANTKQNKYQLGITLIALVITIIVLLILSGVAISMITGEGGLFSKSNHAADRYNIESQKEGNKINQLMTYLNGNYTEEFVDEENDESISININIANSTALFGITGTVNVSVQGDTIDNSKSKYIFVKDNGASIGKNINNYTEGNLTGENTTIEKAKGPGNWYLHVLVTTSTGKKASAVSSNYITIAETEEIGYTGSEETRQLLVGNYKLETWGAQGGSVINSGTTYRGGYGAYAVGNLQINENKTIYVNVGGTAGSGYSIGNTDYVTQGGYNGGGATGGRWTGNANATQLYGAGGGCTHIAYDTGLLSELGSTENVLLIAAGGGGAEYFSHNNTPGFDAGELIGIGGSGGGNLGGLMELQWSMLDDLAQYAGNIYLASQSSGSYLYWNNQLVSSTEQGSFGLGGTGHTGGGGGLYGGDGCGFGGTGGSSYFNQSLLSNAHMSAYYDSTAFQTTLDTLDVDIINDLSQMTINTTLVTQALETPTADTAKINNGYAKITNMN